MFNMPWLSLIICISSQSGNRRTGVLSCLKTWWLYRVNQVVHESPGISDWWHTWPYCGVLHAASKVFRTFQREVANLTPVARMANLYSDVGCRGADSQWISPVA